MDDIFSLRSRIGSNYDGIIHRYNNPIDNISKRNEMNEIVKEVKEIKLYDPEELRNSILKKFLEYTLKNLNKERNRNEYIS